MNALEFAREYLKKEPKAAFAEIRDAAKKKKITLYAISYGRAQALEGIVKSRPYGANRKAKKSTRGPGRPKGSTRGPGRPKGSTRGPGRPKGSKNKVKRGPGRPRKSAILGGEAVNELMSSIKNMQRERDDAVRILEKIRRLLD